MGALLDLRHERLEGYVVCVCVCVCVCELSVMSDSCSVDCVPCHRVWSGQVAYMCLIDVTCLLNTLLLSVCGASTVCLSVCLSHWLLSVVNGLATVC